MGAGYRVLLADLQATASAFNSEADALGRLAPKISPPAVDTGDGGLDATLSALLDTFGVYATALPARVREHGGKLQKCHDNYHRNESDVVELYNNMIKDLED
jgi:hypothetical protein